MATAAQRHLAIPEALARDLARLAQRKGKSIVAVLRDLVTENKENVLRTLDNQRDITPLDSDTVLKRARRVRGTPKNLRLNDQLLRSIKGV